MGSLSHEFANHRRIALKGSESEVSGRLIGLLDWMESVPALATILSAVREAGGANFLDQTRLQEVASRRTNFLDPLRDVRPPDARTIEQIASVGLSLIAEAREQDRSIADLAWDFGIEGGLRISDGVIGRYVIPFLDFVEQQLPTSVKQGGSAERSYPVPAVIHDSLKQFRRAHPAGKPTCFIMMRFGKTPAHARLEKTIKKSLKKHGLTGLLARDREFHDDLYPNIQTYLHGCTFGIAVFERLETDEFNPNVALEVGYMFGMRKQVLLLKDRTLHALQTDLVGKLYREFDPQSPEETIPRQVDSWLSDKGLA